MIDLHRFIARAFIIASLSIIPASYAATPVDNSLAPMLKSVLPAVVNIKSIIKVTDFSTLREIERQQRSQNKNNDQQQQQPVPDKFSSVASGVIVDANKGYILTNAHVISDAQKVTVTLADGRHFTAKVIGLDKATDIGLLQINAKNLTALALADSKNIQVGDYVAAIGSPFGLNQSVSSGIVSAVGRNTLGIENYENFIQTDAPINPGNSGGALVDMQGHLIGINTAILAPDRGSIGIGFAIPSNMAKSIMQQLIEYGNVKRGVLGIGAQDITPELAGAFNLANNQGAVITLVLPDSPAQQAGLQIGDIITSINSNPVTNASDVVNTIGFLRVDSRASMDVLRNNKKISLNVALSDPSKRKEAVEKSDPFLFGMSLKNFSILSPIHGNIKGVLIVSVDEDSNGYNAELRPGDIITSANQQKITSIDELRTIANKSDKTLLLNVVRGPSALFLVINK